MATKGTKNRKIADAEASTVMAAVQGLDLSRAVNEVGTLQVSIQSTLAQVGAQLTNKIQQLEQVEAAIKLKEERLEELHQIEVEAVSLDDLRAKVAEEEADWKRRQVELDRVAVEQEANRRNGWQRAQEEHDYKTAQLKQRAIEEHQAEVARHKREEQIRQDTLEREWEAREAALKAQETEVENLRNQVANFDTKLKQEVAKAEGIVANTLKRQYEHETQLLKKDMETERSLNQARMEGLNATIASYRSQIDELQEQLTTARNDAKEVASKALDSASGRQVADALRNVVDGQNQTSPTGKR